MPEPTPRPIRRRRIVALLWTILALVPVSYVAIEAASASRNFPFYDEIDSAVGFVMALDSSQSWPEWLQEFFAVSNEHRMVTSRALFATSYWLTGTVNFHVIGAIGNLFIVATALLLIGAAQGTEQRIRVGVILAFLIFQLENYENFVWSGASIDHFQVVLLVVAAIVAITRGTRTATALAALFSLLATLMLAHGILAWPLCALWLAHQRSRQQLIAWSIVSALGIGLFFAGFSFNPGHQIDTGAGTLPQLAYFWLQLIGAPITLGHREFAAIPGFFLLICIGLLLKRGAFSRQPVPMMTAFFGIGALVLIAYGRLRIEGDVVTSRYMILGTVAWAMVLATLLEHAATAERPYRWLAWATPALVGFNVTAALVFQSPKEAFIEVRDRAATYLIQNGRAGSGISRIHPVPQHAEHVLKTAAARGVYRLPPVSKEVRVPLPHPSTRIITHVDELVMNDRWITIGGWAMIPGRSSKRGDVKVVLEADDRFSAFTTLTLQRPDVARAYGQPRWRLCGFRAVIRRDQLSARNFRVGVLVGGRRAGEYVMTDNLLPLEPASVLRPKEQLATRQ